LAWQQARKLKCPGCGHWLDESRDIDHEDCWDAAVTTCHACAAVRRELARFEKEGVTEGLYASARHVCGLEV